MRAPPIRITLIDCAGIPIIAVPPQMHTFAPAVTGIDSASIAVIAVLSLMVAFSIHTGVDSAGLPSLQFFGYEHSPFTQESAVQGLPSLQFFFAYEYMSCSRRVGGKHCHHRNFLGCERIRFHSMYRWYKRCRHRISLTNGRKLHSNNSLLCSRFDHRSLSAYECIPHSRRNRLCRDCHHRSLREYERILFHSRHLQCRHCHHHRNEGGQRTHLQ